MRILMVVHQFLPRHLAGSEVYTYALAAELRRRGHDVRLFFTEIRPERPQYELRRGEYDGIPYFEAVHNRWFPSFRHTYADAEMEAVFRRVLAETEPDVLHIQHLYLHSIGYIDIAREHGLPIVYTLHEYMLMCLRSGLLLRPGTVLCDGPEVAACATCATAVQPDGSTVAPVMHFDPARRPSGRIRALLAKLRAARSTAGAEVRAAVERRLREIRSALAEVDLFIAPSAFLRQRFIDVGMIAEDRIVHSDNGFSTAPFASLRREPSPTLRVGYVGTISEFKGVHLIGEAFEGIEDPGIECRIYGDLETFPDYTRQLAGRDVPAVRFLGRLENRKIAEALADLDVLIVPSLWFENSPSTIHEAFLAGVPVLTGDRGGMAELVADGESGLHFRIGDAADLRRQILRLRHERGLLERLRRGIPRVKTIEEDAASMEARYCALRARGIPAA